MTIRKLVYATFLVSAFIFSFFFFESTQPSLVVNAQQCTPGVLISKEVKGDDLRIFPVGSDVSFEITIQNTGNVDLTNLHVSDPRVSDCERSFASLAIGGTINYSCTATAVTQGFQNVAKVTAASSCGDVNNLDTSTVNLAGLAVSKQEKGEDSRVFSSGDDVTFTIVVTNTGEIDLTNITISDPLVPSCVHEIASLPVGQLTTYECTEDAVTAGFTNVVTATTSVSGLILSDNDPSTVKVPAIDIRKQAEGADTRTVASGSDVTFDIVVTNSGDVDLTNIEVSDPLAPDCDRVIESLLVGQETSYSCTMENVTEGFTNIATVSGENGDLTVTDNDPSTVEIDDNYELYMPIIVYSGIIKFDVSIGYEDLRLVQSNDFDYNDWVVRVNTDFTYSSFAQETIDISQVAFQITPQARGALLPHEFHFSLPPNTFASNGIATLQVVDPVGNILKNEQTAFIASQLNDYKVFDLTSDALPPASAGVNIIEGVEFTQAQQIASLTIQFDTPFLFTLTDFGPHGEGLFFEPYLRVIPSARDRYNIGNGDVRTIVFPFADWRWPEEGVRIDRAYPGITYIGEPNFFEFPDGWWLIYNNCIFGDGVVCQ